MGWSWCRRGRGLGRFWVSHVDEYGRSKSLVGNSQSIVAATDTWAPTQLLSRQSPLGSATIDTSGEIQFRAQAKEKGHVRLFESHVAQPDDEDEAAEERGR